MHIKLYQNETKGNFCLQKIFVLLLFCSFNYQNSNAQCIVSIERLSDTSIKIVGTGAPHTSTSTSTGNSIGIVLPGLFSTDPSSPLPVLSDNNLEINDVSNPIPFNVIFPFNIPSTVTLILGGSLSGSFSVTGEITLTWADGVIADNGTTVDIFYNGSNNVVCTIPIGGSANSTQNIPTLSEWGLIILALLLLTFGTLYLLQPNWKESKQPK